MMYIANPIYDVVFKFMMEDSKVAKAFLSAIIGEEVAELDFAAQEQTVHIVPEERKEPEGRPVAEQRLLTVCRFDFSAKISVPGGYKTVLIELQKAKFVSDLMRFRRYISMHYRNPENMYGDKKNPKARQIYCVFLLGYDIGPTNSPVLRVDPKVTDVATGVKLDISSEFILGLHHRSWIVQINTLKRRRRTDLERLLSIFDQDNRINLDQHILNINEDDVPEKYRPIIRRLRMAAESEKIQGEMELEDDILTELQEKEREIENREKIIEEQGKALEEKDKVLEEKDKVLEEQGKTLEEKDKALEEKDKALGEKDRVLEEQERMIEELKRQLAEKN